jgi:hypothetical protein
MKLRKADAEAITITKAKSMLREEMEAWLAEVQSLRTVHDAAYAKCGHTPPDLPFDLDAIERGVRGQLASLDADIPDHNP